MFHRPITASLSPNTESDDVAKALLFLLRLWLWKQGNQEKKVSEWFYKTYNGFFCLLYNSGRSGLLELLRAFGIGKNDEVIVQAFTCVAVPNSVLWAGATPVYADIDTTYNIDPSDVEKKITGKTKAIIVQHTFGIPAQISKLKKLAERRNILLIEDCAHALGAATDQKLLGSWGDAAFFSFGRDKVLSSVFGGAVIINNKHLKARELLVNSYDKLPYPSYFWIFQQLIHPVAFAMILPLYSSGVGKLILAGLQKMNILSFPVYKKEKQGLQPSDFPKRYSNALAGLLFNQLKKLDRFRKMRKNAVMYYEKMLHNSKNIIIPEITEEKSLLRFPVEFSNPEEVIKHAKKENVLLGNWYHAVIDPEGVSYAALGYKIGSCKNAEKSANRILNLPTRISLIHAEQTIKSIRSYV